MTLRNVSIGIFISCCLIVWTSCDHDRRSESTQFTKLDSLTDTYLLLKDSMLATWNAMIHDDNQKLKAMENLLHELQVSNPQQREELTAYEERLEQLKRSRYTQKTMANSHVVEEYDFASTALVTELVTMAESQRQYVYNTTLQKLVETIRTSEQTVRNFRDEYDAIATRFNQFIEKNRPVLSEVDEDSFLEKRPLFQMAEE